MKLTRSQLRRLIEVYVVTPEGEAHDARSRYKEKIEPEMKAAHPGLKRLMGKIDPWDQHVKHRSRGAPEAERYSDTISQPYSLYSSMTDDDVDAAVLDHETAHPERGMHHEPYMNIEIRDAHNAIDAIAIWIDNLGLGFEYDDFRGLPDKVITSVAQSLAKDSEMADELTTLSTYIDNQAFVSKYVLPLYDNQKFASRTILDILDRAYRLKK